MSDTTAHPISAFRDDVLAYHDGVEVARLVASGAVRVDEVVEAAIARAERVNPTLNAIAFETFDQARDRAAQPIVGRFGGVPTFIKDTDDVKGAPTRWGSRATPRRLARQSSKFVEHFSSVGLRSLGKSTMPEFGFTATTESLATGATCNPWHPDYSPGGSSGGAAALVAAGVVPFAHANDGGGSIRIPAACCGLFGLKPSRSRLPDVTHAKLMPMNLIAHGILSRTVRDTAEFFAAAERHYRNPGLPKLGLVSHPGHARLRIGMFTDTPYGLESDPDCVTTVHEATKICEELGHDVEEIIPPFGAEDLDAFFLCWATLAFGVTRLGKVLVGDGFDKNRLEPSTLQLERYFRRNAWRVPASARRLHGLSRRYAKLFERFDVVVSPTMSGPPIKLGSLGPPIGVQFASAVGNERCLLELALALEAARPWRRCGAH